MTKKEIKATIENYVEKGLYYPVESGEYVGGCYVDRAIEKAGVREVLAGIVGIEYKDGEEPVAISANKAGGDVEIYVDGDASIEGYYTVDEFAEKFGE